MTNVFNTPTDNVDPLQAELETLRQQYVKEDGNVDIDGLLKAKAHSNIHIKNIEAETAMLRDDLKSRAPLEDLVARLSNNSVNSERQVDIPNVPSSEVDVEARVDAKISALRNQMTAEQNVKYVQEELTKVWGPNFQEKLLVRARELGEDVDELALMAQSKPKRFLTLMTGGQTSNMSNFQTPRNEVRTQNSKQANGPRTYADFKKMRKENPSLYYSIPMQRELLKAATEAAARGENFTQE